MQNILKDMQPLWKQLNVSDALLDEMNTLLNGAMHLSEILIEPTYNNTMKLSDFIPRNGMIATTLKNDLNMSKEHMDLAMNTKINILLVSYFA